MKKLRTVKFIVSASIYADTPKLGWDEEEQIQNELCNIDTYPEWLFSIDIVESEDEGPEEDTK